VAILRKTWQFRGTAFFFSFQGTIQYSLVITMPDSQYAVRARQNSVQSPYLCHLTPFLVLPNFLHLVCPGLRFHAVDSANSAGRLLFSVVAARAFSGLLLAGVPRAAPKPLETLSPAVQGCTERSAYHIEHIIHIKIHYHRNRLTWTTSFRTSARTDFSSSVPDDTSTPVLSFTLLRCFIETFKIFAPISSSWFC
jgi:hypothetical protein